MKIGDTADGDVVQLTLLIVRHGPSNQILAKVPGVGSSGTWSLHRDVECTLVGPSLLPPEVVTGLQDWVEEHKT